MISLSTSLQGAYASAWRSSNGWLGSSGMRSGTDSICGHERATLLELLMLLERHGSESAENALRAFIKLQGDLGLAPKSNALRALLEHGDIAAIMTAAHREIDPRWTYRHARKCANEYVVCEGPGERTELTADEARWKLLNMLRLPSGATRADFIRALDANRGYEVPR